MVNRVILLNVCYPKQPKYNPNHNWGSCRNIAWNAHELDILPWHAWRWVMQRAQVHVPCPPRTCTKLHVANRTRARWYTMTNPTPAIGLRFCQANLVVRHHIKLTTSCQLVKRGDDSSNLHLNYTLAHITTKEEPSPGCSAVLEPYMSCLFVCLFVALILEDVRFRKLL